MSTKPELVAIYRLEFYRKQKNWKLSSSRIDKKSSKKCSEKESTLNVTYDVDNSEDKKEQSDPHNIAFMESDSDKNVPLTSDQASNQKHHLLLERQEPVNIWPDISIEKDEKLKSSESHDKLKQNRAQNRLKLLQIAANLSKTELIDDNGIAKENCDQGTERWSSGMDWQYECDDQIKKEGGLLDHDVADDIWSYGIESDVVDSPSFSNMHSECHQPGLLDVPWTTDIMEEEWGSTSVDSLGEFCRGADAAPHSSELDLSLPPCVATPDVSFAALSRLSTPQLVLAARRHARALRRLLAESAHRQVKAVESSKTEDISDIEEDTIASNGEEDSGESTDEVSDQESDNAMIQERKEEVEKTNVYHEVEPTVVILNAIEEKSIEERKEESEPNNSSNPNNSEEKVTD